ncbi:MAG: complex I subunit 1/NuoH family protein, partial [Anaerolineae bacterium]
MEYISNLFVNLGNSWTSLLSSFLPPWAVTLVNNLVVAVLLVLMPVIATLTLTVMERKVIARIQNRIGPNRVGPWGIFQAIPDAIKLLTKEDIVPERADRPLFNLAPLLIFVGAALLWAVIPFGRGLIGQDLNVGVLYLVAVGSISTIAIIMAGWSSNNKFALVGAFRIVALLLSYEVPMVLS